MVEKLQGKLDPEPRIIEAMSKTVDYIVHSLEGIDEVGLLKVQSLVNAFLKSRGTKASEGLEKLEAFIQSIEKEHR